MNEIFDYVLNNSDEIECSGTDLDKESSEEDQMMKNILLN